MRVITTIQEMLEERAHWPDSQSVGFVPTMGFLHEGHLSLVRRARTENAVLMASIFVNPTQFSPHEDLARYPRDLPRDLHLLEDCGVDAVFIPSPEEIYPPGFGTYIEPADPLRSEAEGKSRPGHFRGVATIVLKLFQIIRPHSMYFGQKDAQQILVISQMIRDLNLPVLLRPLPTIRESDGLAMSSRNAYLNQSARAASTILYKALLAGQRTFENSATKDVLSVVQAMETTVAEESLARLDYAEVRDPRTFLPLTTLSAPALLIIAASLGTTRLIDNFLLQADGTWEIGLSHP